MHTSGDVDIGDITAVTRGFVVKGGFFNINNYYIPISKVEGGGWRCLVVNDNREEVKRNDNYGRDVISDPSRYYVKDYPNSTTSYYTELMRVPQKYRSPSNPAPCQPTGSGRNYRYKHLVNVT